MSRRAFCVFALACLLAVPALTVYGKKRKPPAGASPSRPADDRGPEGFIRAQPPGLRTSSGRRRGCEKFGLDSWIEVATASGILSGRIPLLAPSSTARLAGTARQRDDRELSQSAIDPRDGGWSRRVSRGSTYAHDDPPPAGTLQEGRGESQESPRAVAAAERVEEMSMAPDLDAVINSLTPDQQTRSRMGRRWKRWPCSKRFPSRRRSMSSTR